MAVPALISEETFALAQEQLEQNKRHSPRRTIEPSLLQGMRSFTKWPRAGTFLR
jgi:site-specific DNA recombinase